MEKGEFLLRRKVISIALSYVLLSFTLLGSGLNNQKNAMAFTDEQTTIEGTVLPSIINVSVPTKIAFSIDPNTKVFNSSNIEIINNSNAPIQVLIRKGSNNFTLTNDSPWKPENVMPEDQNWEKLNTKNSENYIALGIKITGDNWREIHKSNALYVKEQNSMLNDVLFGSINGNSSANMEMVCSYGLAFKEEKECTFRLVLSFKID